MLFLCFSHFNFIRLRGYRKPRETKRRFAQQFRIPRGDDFIIFSESGGVADPDNLQHYFSRRLRKLGPEQVKLHAIRHTFAARAIENGIGVSTVSGILGHADVTTTTHFYVRMRSANHKRLCGNQCKQLCQILLCNTAVVIRYSV